MPVGAEMVLELYDRLEAADMEIARLRSALRNAVEIDVVLDLLTTSEAVEYAEATLNMEDFDIAMCIMRDAIRHARRETERD